MARRKRLRIATFNVNGIQSRLPHLLTWLEREAPDIVALQELKASQDAFPEAAIRDSGYGCLWQGQRAWNGVALLARGQDPMRLQSQQFGIARTKAETIELTGHRTPQL